MCSFAEKSYNRQHKSNHSYEGDLRKLKFENTVVVCGKTEMLTYLPTMNSFFHFIFLRSWNHPIQNATLLHTGQGTSRMSPWGAVHRRCFLVQIIVCGTPGSCLLLVIITPVPETSGKTVASPSYLQSPPPCVGAAPLFWLTHETVMLSFRA